MHARGGGRWRRGRGPESPGRAIERYWVPDDDTIVLVVDDTFPNLLNFNVGSNVDLLAPNGAPPPPSLPPHRETRPRTAASNAILLLGAKFGPTPQAEHRFPNNT